MRDLARVVFLASLPVIEKELGEGWTAKAIYQRHSDKLKAISYPQFARYCRPLRVGTPSERASPQQRG